jgi:hypothetical protein
MPVTPAMMAVGMMRNEEDVCVQVVRHLLAEGIDHVLVAENMSTDRTRQLLHQLEREDRRLRVVDDEEPTYDQGTKMTGLAHQAHRLWGAGWIVPFDADELWTGADGRPLGDVLRELAAGPWDSATADKWEMVPHPDDDPLEPDPFARIRHCQPVPHAGYKTAFRHRDWTRIGAGNHRVSTMGRCAESALTLRHYSLRSLEQARAKFRHGASVLPADWPPTWGGHWRDLGAMDDEAFSAWWATQTDPTTLVRFEAQPATISPEARSTPPA